MIILNETTIGNIKLVIPQTLDEAALMAENPLLYEQYCYTETKKVFDKKKFEKAQAIMFKKYQKDMPPRLTVK